MSFDYINEAFKKLNILEETMFDGSVDGINNLNQFLKDDDEIESVRVIDPEAESDEELEDSYIGKVIINCNICHSHIFENKEDIVIDDEGVVNSDMSCPYCKESDGFVILGEIKPYETEDKTQNEDSEVEDSIEENLQMSRATRRTMTDAETMDEGLFNKGPSHAIIVKQNRTDGKGVNFDWIVLAVSNNVAALEEEAANLCTYTTQVDGSPTQAKVVDIKTAKKLTGEKRFIPSDWLIEDDDEEELTEDFKEVSIKTDDQHLEMTSDENGKVTVTTEPIVEEQSGEEMISPVSAETQSEIIENNEEVVDEDEPVEDSTDTSDEDTSDEDTLESDVDIEEVDEKGMDELGESYFKNVYENVTSFKTTDVSANANTLIIEGLITFNSGAKKKTGFMFESKDINSRGQLRFVGTNKQLSETNNSFSLVGRVDNSKLFVESLKYNYTVGDKTVRGRVTRK